jgi:hypothetical protein
MKILINYKYEYYPFTTASYFEMAAKALGHQMFRTTDDFNPAEIDFVLNVETCDKIIRLPNVPCLYYEIDNHIIEGRHRHFYDLVDLVLIAQPRFLEYYTDYKTAIIPLACWPDVHKPFYDESIIYDIGFIGNDTYPYRRRLLEVLEKNFRVLRTTSKPGEPYSRLLNQCKLTFNCAMRSDVNMRFFEAIASGRLLLTDYLPEQDSFATVGDHYVCYKDEENLIENVNYYLEHTKAREEIAHRGVLHMHKNHSYLNRLNEIICLVKNLKS